jgi:hypothetical protein
MPRPLPSSLAFFLHRGRKYYMPKKVIRRKNKREALTYYFRFRKYFSRLVNEQMAIENRILQLEVREIKGRMMLSCWDDHGPMKLREAMKMYNRRPYGLACDCLCCVVEADHHDETRLPSSASTPCALFQMLLCKMLKHDITHAIAEPFEGCEDPDFDPDSACKYLTPVSHHDVHLVFPEPYENPYKFYYGRKLWEIEDSFDHAELNKLKRLIEDLNSKDPSPLYPEPVTPTSPYEDEPDEEDTVGSPAY